MSISSVAGFALAAVLALAAVAKIRHPAATRRSMAELGLVQPELLARLIPASELGCAAALVTVPAWGGVAAFALIAAFTTVLVRIVRSGRIVSCACFGARSTKPVSVWSLVRNGALLALALIAVVG